nr:ATP-binding protein [Allomuricauda sp.]
MNTIRGRVLAAFFILFILIGPFLFFAFNSLKKIDNAKSLRESVAVFDGNRLKAENEFYHVLDFDTKLDSFYIEKSTQSLKKYHFYIHNSRYALEDVKLAKNQANTTIDIRLGRITDDLNDLHSKVIHVIGLIRQKGFKNFGTIGEMRKSIHALEKEAKGVSLAEILQMRRKEKDFFLRNDYGYVADLNIHCNNILARLESNPKADKQTIKLLKAYQDNFNLVVNLTREIGDGDSGGIQEIQDIHNGLNAKVEKLYSIVDADSEIMIGSIKSYLVLFFSITVLFAMLSAFVFSGHIAKPIQKLITDMDSIAQNNFQGQLKKDKTIRIEEIDKLTGTYNSLVGKIRGQISTLSEKNKTLSSLNGKLVESENELKEASRIKDKFFSIISHDLRGHTGNVLSLANILKDDKEKLGEEEKGLFIKYLSDASHNLQMLLDNLLNWAKTQMNDHEISKRMFSMGDVIEKNVALFRENALRKGVSLHFEPRTRPNAYADKNMIDFVVRNLLSNALKFTKNGDTITFDVLEHEGHLEILVKDTGIGMDQKQQEALLSSTKENYSTKGTDNEEGTGLGFAICKDFIRRNSGTINIESELNKGSTFSFTVPTDLTRDSILKVS